MSLTAFSESCVFDAIAKQIPSPILIPFRFLWNGMQCSLERAPSESKPFTVILLSESEPPTITASHRLLSSSWHALIRALPDDEHAVAMV